MVANQWPAPPMPAKLRKEYEEREAAKMEQVDKELKCLHGSGKWEGSHFFLCDDCGGEIFVDDHTFARARAEKIELQAENVELRKMLKLYREKVPIGHQPHMMAHKVDELLSKGDEQ